MTHKTAWLAGLTLLLTALICGGLYCWPRTLTFHHSFTVGQSPLPVTITARSLRNSPRTLRFAHVPKLTFYSQLPADANAAPYTLTATLRDRHERFLATFKWTLTPTQDDLVATRLVTQTVTQKPVRLRNTGNHLRITIQNSRHQLYAKTAALTLSAANGSFQY
ncbi:hypothetical protein [Lacticaseibacillus daqingensis]|uniref:hypothetical protein n=1 Tax=Lacticaseibacillus daqingensis TaxID=2486014 RepID=UPI000F799E0B|nr:hypothetical protein [Lacticaseibacillus daqingensis]